MLLVGLTGGLGAGKSTVARMLRDRGAVVVDADALARRAIAPGTHGYHEVRQAFGDEVVGAGGEIDRAALARVVFADPEKRRALESVTHPEVFRLLAQEAETLRGTGAVLVFDAPLISEAVDVLVGVSAPEAERLRRVMGEREMSEGEARSRMAAQVSAEDRETRADLVVRNEGDLEALGAAVDEVWDELRRRADAEG